MMIVEIKPEENWSYVPIPFLMMSIAFLVYGIMLLNIFVIVFGLMASFLWGHSLKEEMFDITWL